ncbi:MAG: Ig-like domain-containing protein [Thermodesulfobacteriota bacterium]|nr:Ig-like domain-containing protein [Thermodesulfobacteriota bacterium]
MNYTKNIQKLRTPLFAVAALALTAGPALAVDLVAIDGQWSPDGGTTQIPMWGFATDTGQACNSLPTWTVGPQLTDTDLVAGNLTINLRNCLSEGVSIVIPGQPATFTPVTTTDAQGRTRITAFTTEAALGGTASYTWTGVKDGTYLYQSGSHPAKQVQMGLYGALTVGTYAGTSGNVTLLYSEIDPALHSPSAAATPLGYKPRHYLVNGLASQPTLSAGDTNQPTVLRFLNAGLDFHVPTLNGGYMTLGAEDGNLYPFPKEQYSVNLAAGKTIDALWLPASEGNHVIYDRRGNGMVATLTVGAGVGAPVAAADSYAVDEGSSLVTIAGNLTFPGVLDNDPGPGTLTAILVSAPSNGTLNPSLADDGSFAYTPNDYFNGQDSFTYKANDGTLDSNVASVSVTVHPMNNAPVANDDAYDAVESETLSVATPGVLGNDTDVDGDSLTVTTTSVSGPTNGTLVLNADGSFEYTPTGAAPGIDSFVYQACDGEPLCDTATVNLTIIATPNSPPVAVEDSATVVRNSTAFINLTDNDSDPDGNLKDINGDVTPDQITITTGAKTTRGGTVTVLTNGVNYTPKKNFRGTDTFNYTVTDLAGAESNEVTVRVNVVK